jgi:nicotinate-nucleotide--dimethylbenzimidazole phosphoribosyltransferase
MIEKEIQHKIDFKTKPLGALGKLEAIALQIGSIQNSLSPKLNKPTIVVFAGDHGVAREGVSAYPQEVTFQMVMNFLQGGAAINVFCKQNSITLKVVDAGVNFEFEKNQNLINAKIGLGTKSFLTEKAMTATEQQLCFEKGAEIVNEIFENSTNIIGFGEMGIGNTSAATLIMAAICQLPIESCVGRGTGLNDEKLKSKIDILQKAQNFHGNLSNPLAILHTFGGFEIAQMVGAMLTAYEKNMIILVDGFIATSAFLVAFEINSKIKENAIFCHLSDEFGHRNMLNFIKVEPILNLNMRLGEGTGCAIAYPIIESSLAFLNEMASFEAAGVSNKEKE